MKTTLPSELIQHVIGQLLLIPSGWGCFALCRQVSHDWKILAHKACPEGVTRLANAAAADILAVRSRTASAMLLDAARQLLAETTSLRLRRVRKHEDVQEENEAHTWEYSEEDQIQEDEWSIDSTWIAGAHAIMEHCVSTTELELDLEFAATSLASLHLDRLPALQVCRLSKVRRRKLFGLDFSRATNLREIRLEVREAEDEDEDEGPPFIPILGELMAPSGLITLSVDDFPLLQDDVANLGVQHMPSLSSLRLLKVKLEPRGVKALSLGDCQQLQDLNLSFNNLGDEGLAVLCKSSLPQLRVLRLCDNEISDLGPLTSSLTELLTLDLGGNRISDLAPLGSYLDRNPRLLELILNSNRISDIAPLCLVNRHKLQKLYLSGNRIVDASPLVLSRNASMHFLDLSHNRLAAASALQLEDNSVLSSLRLSGNPLADYELGLSSKNALRSLYLDNIKCSEEMARQLARQLEGNATLHTLSLARCEVTGAIARVLVGGRNNGLRELNLNSHHLTEDDLLELSEAVKHHPTLNRVDIRYPKAAFSSACEAELEANTRIEYW